MSPEQVVAACSTAIIERRWRDVLSHLIPETLAEFGAQQLTSAHHMRQRGDALRYHLERFGVASIVDLEALTPGELFCRWLERADIRNTGRYVDDVLVAPVPIGHVMEGKDTAHVVCRHPLRGDDLVVISLRRSDRGHWLAQADYQTFMGGFSVGAIAIDVEIPRVAASE